MELLIKATLVALASCLCMAAIKKHAPEHAMLLALATAVAICAAAVPAVRTLAELWGELASASSLSGAVIAPVAKCVGLGLLTSFCADLCRDNGSSSIATAVELVGCLCALMAASPLMLMLLEMIGGGS